MHASSVMRQGTVPAGRRSKQCGRPATAAKEKEHRSARVHTHCWKTLNEKHAASLHGVRVPYIFFRRREGGTARAVLVCDWLCDRGDEAFPTADTAAALYNAITLYPRLTCGVSQSMRFALSLFVLHLTGGALKTASYFLLDVLAIA